MKRFIAIALVGMCSFLMVGTVYASFDKKAYIELEKDENNYFNQVAILDAVTPSVAPKYGKMVTVLSEDVIVSGYKSDITAKANSPPSIRKL